jgi:uncharacterized protein YaiI (UPF0178 family)
VEYSSVAKALRETRAPVVARHQDDQARPAADAQPANAAVNEIIEADRIAVNMERELVALLVSDASLLDEVGKDLVRIKWHDAAAEKMADALLAVSHDATPAQALFAVTQAVPEAPTLLAQVMVESDERTERLYQARLLVRSLRARDLEASVRSAKAQMQGESDLAPEELDKLFEKTVSMQKELAKLRNEGIREQS